MTLSISAIAGSPASTAPRTTASTGIFALSLAQLTAAPVAGSDADAPQTGDPTAKNDDDKRQDDAADGNALPLPTSLAPDPSLLAALLVPPVPVAAPVLPVGDTAPAAGPPGVDAVAVAAAISGIGPGTDTGTGTIVAPTSPAAAVVDSAPPTVTDAPAETVPVAAASSAPPPIPIPGAASLPDPTTTTLPAGSSVVDALPSPAVAAAPLPAVLPVAPSTLTPTTLVATPAPAQPTPIPPPSAVAAAMPIVALVAPVSTTGVAADAPPPATVTTVPTVDTPPPIAGTIQIDTRSAPVVALPPAAPPPLQGATTTSAIQAFGSAMRAGLARDPRLDTGTDGAAGAIAGGRTTHTDQTPAVAATGDAQQAPLDLRREQWPHAMIDRIEALRDAADATSTKIRVVPDALGPVEMSVRRDGDTLHVHFTADQAATRAILTDAQPRLAAIAEQRGLRLGGSTVDGGSTNTGAGQQQQQQAATRQPNAPPPSFPSTTATAADDDDTRIA